MSTDLEISCPPARTSAVSVDKTGSRLDAAAAGTRAMSAPISTPGTVVRGVDRRRPLHCTRAAGRDSGPDHLPRREWFAALDQQGLALYPEPHLYGGTSAWFELVPDPAPPATGILGPLASASHHHSRNPRKDTHPRDPVRTQALGEIGQASTYEAIMVIEAHPGHRTVSPISHPFSRATEAARPGRSSSRDRYPRSQRLHTKTVRGIRTVLTPPSDHRRLSAATSSPAGSDPANAPPRPPPAHRRWLDHGNRADVDRRCCAQQYTSLDSCARPPTSTVTVQNKKLALTHRQCQHLPEGCAIAPDLALPVSEC